MFTRAVHYPYPVPELRQLLDCSDTSIQNTEYTLRPSHLAVQLCSTVSPQQLASDSAPSIRV